MTYLIDRRLQGKNKSAINRERFLRRGDAAVGLPVLAHRDDKAGGRRGDVGGQLGRRAPAESDGALREGDQRRVQKQEGENRRERRAQL